MIKSWNQKEGSKMKIFLQLLFLVSILFMSGCSPKYHSFKNSNAIILKQEFKDLDSFLNDDLNYALEVFQKDCKKSSKNSMFKKVCEKAQIATNGEKFFIQNFTPYKLLSKNEKDEGTITGYYEPLLQGSLTKSKKYPYPVYGIPKDMITIKLNSVYPELKRYRLRGKLKKQTLVPYDTRAQINKRTDIKNIICYVDDKVDLFFLQIQGSGKVRLDSGKLLNLSYSSQNGRKYNSVGKIMIKKGYIGNGIDASMQGMKKWFKDNPSKVDELLNHNKSYVFFAKSKYAATGALGTQLVGARNIAVDKRYIPLGMPVFIQTKNPLTKSKINRIVVAADVGGAIKGDIRADFFYGFGQKAEDLAGRMKEKGKLIMLVPNDVKVKEI